MNPLRNAPLSNSAQAWHALAARDVLQQLGSTEHGLSNGEAAERLKIYGPNRLPPPKRTAPWVRFLLQFHNVLIYVLIAAAAITGAMAFFGDGEHWIDTGVIIAVVVINAIIGYIQEGKAERALEAVRQMLSHEATVVRDGNRLTVPAENVVPGDVVVLHSGDKVPADLRLFQTRDLRIDEAVLTGESVPVDKDIRTVDKTASLGDRVGMAFSGTLVTYGQAMGVVTATGERTEIGRISAMLQGVEELTTPLLRKISTFGRVLSAVVIALAFFTFLIGYVVHDTYTPGDLFMVAVAVAVSAIPEGLPAIMTITLALGVQRMARRHAIIRRLPAVDTLGSVTVICSDKTGTLTRNEMTVTSVITSQGHYQVSGVGYAPNGGFTRDGQPVEPHHATDLLETLRGAMLCSEAQITQDDTGRWTLVGEPTEGALMAAAMKADLQRDLEQRHWPRNDAIPFESEHKYMATLHHNHENSGLRVVYVKGAPERVIAMCSHQGPIHAQHDIDRAHWEAQASELARQGKRVLAVAMKTVEPGKVELVREEATCGLSLLGLFGLIDPPRDEAITAIRECQEAGIRVKMITGDHALTATVIGKQLNIGDGSHAITGPEVQAMPPDELNVAVRNTDVFARVNPEHKLRLVAAIQANNEVVAMTGDGVNDAPALKRADVGIAMGRKGTEVAKESSDMVLTDDNFASIAHAVEEGRAVYDNLRKSILFILPTNGGEAVVIIAAIMLGMQLPITPVQILWVNMITTVTLALALGFERPESGVMKRPPRDPDAPLLSPFFMWRISFVSVLLFLGTFGAYLAIRLTQGDAVGEEAAEHLAYARTVAVNTLVLLETVYLFNTRFITAPALTRAGLFGSGYAVAAAVLAVIFQLLFTYLPAAQKLFHTRAIAPHHWLGIVVIAIGVFFIIELEKAIVRRRNMTS